MSQIKYFIITILFLSSKLLIGHAQQINDADLNEVTLGEKIDQAKNLEKRGDYIGALNNLESALDIASKLEDKKKIGVIYTKIGKLQFLTNESDKAMSNLNKAISIQREENDAINLGLTYNLRGVMHSNLEEYDAALSYFSNASENFNNPNAERYQADVLLNEAIVYIKQEKYDIALVKLERVIVIAKKFDLDKIISNAYIKSAEINQIKKNSSLALEQANLGLSKAESENFVNVRNQAYHILSEIYQSQNDYQSANEYLNEHIRLSDSILQISRNELDPEIKAKYIIAYQKGINEQLSDQPTEASDDESLERIATILSISLITILSLLTLSLYKNNNIRLRTNNMLQVKNDELIAAKEKAELASKTKANLLSTVTHELRTPLYAVTGLTNLLLDEEPKPKQVQHLKSLKFSVDYLLTFINDILQINKIEANKVELDPEEFNLKTKIENVVAALQNSAKDNNTSIHLDYEKDLPELYHGDQLKISQILINLLGNAIKFTKVGDIWVRVKAGFITKTNYVVNFEIEDNGIGISKEKQENMFESFSQGSIQINRKYGGTGLGLSIVKGLIKILNGKIWLKSQLGKGTSFFFELPLTLADTKKKTADKKSEHVENIKALDLENIKILIVEDNKINQMITKKILTKMGLSCDVVDNGEDAVEHVKNIEYSVVLMDIHMPGISGLEATKRIRTFDKELTIFALTAVTLEDKMHEFDEAGFDDIISKPFKQETFEKKLYEALSEKEKATV